MSVYRYKEVPLAQAGAVGHAARVHVIEVLQRGAARGGAQLHERRAGLGAAQHEAEAAPRAVQHHRARLHVAIASRQTTTRIKYIKMSRCGTTIYVECI